VAGINNNGRGGASKLSSDVSAGGALQFRVREYLADSSIRAPTAFVARAIGADRDATYTALSQLHSERLVMRRTDDRGRVWWAARCDVGLTRKERILFALERVDGGQLSTSQLCRSFGERDYRRGYRILDYYRTVGLLEAVNEGVGTEAVWRVKQ
jgi:hypothetical protein